jgi:2'-5' RNA ligase
MTDANDTAPRWQRHFIALMPDAAARDALAAIPVPEGARRPQPDDLHMTLAFLGTLSEDGQAAAIAAAQAAMPAEGLPGVRLDRLESWSEARAFCATVAAPSEALTRLAERLAVCLADRGLPTDGRRFRPHVTLARLGRGAVIADADLATPIAWTPRSLALLASSTVPQPGPRYRVVQKIG